MTISTQVNVDSYTTESAFDSYKAVPVHKLKTTSQKLLEKFWTAKLSALNLKYTPGISVDTLGDQFLMKANIFWQGTSYDEVLTIAELLDTRETEREDSYSQFEINLNNVERILTDKETGILRFNPLMQLPELVKLPGSEQFIIGGGRHRVVAIATLAQVIAGGEHFKVPVRVFTPSTLKEVADFITTSNGSRSMTKTESAMITGLANGINLSVFRDADELFADAAQKSNTVTDLKQFNRSIWPALLKGTQVDRSCSLNGIGDIGNSFLTKFSTLMNKLEPKSANILLRTTQEGSILYEILVRNATNWVNTHWDTVIREQFQDAEGNFNPSRKASKIGNYVAEHVVESSKVQLLKEFEKAKAEAASEAKAKKQKRAATSTEREIKAVESTIASLRAGGVTDEAMFATLDQRLNELKQSLEQKQTEANKAEAMQADNVPANLPPQPTAPNQPMFQATNVEPDMFF